MFRKLRRIRRNRFCDFCRCANCDRRRPRRLYRKMWAIRYRCRDGSVVCRKCYGMPCDPNSMRKGGKPRFCAMWKETGDCPHKPRLAPGHGPKHIADWDPGNEGYDMDELREDFEVFMEDDL